MVYDTNEIIMHGLKYRPGACLLIAWEYTTPVFAQIDKLLVYQYTKLQFVLLLRLGHSSGLTILSMYTKVTSETFLY